ncbi:MAG TPA: glycosyltransferase family 9 protein [Nitrospirota bacterium]|nr:glycosyltransferase family 9 protein [Nitrospirota bacterium]
MKFRSREFSNILINKPGAIGDLVQLTPVVRALKERYPSARISLMVGSETTAGLFRNNPRVAETIVFERKGRHRSFRSLIRLWRSVRAKHYDLVVNFQRSNLKTWFLASAALPCRVLVYHKSNSETVHAVVNYLDTLAPLGIEASDLDLELTPGPDDRAFAESVLGTRVNQQPPVVALNPGASHHVNRWPPERFAALADGLQQELSARVLIIGGGGDVPLAEEIVSRCAAKPLMLAGKIDLLQLAAILERCDVLVSGDTGPLHLATAVGTRVVALFGAADPARTGPVGSGHIVLQPATVSCVPCRSRTCSNARHLECMEAISVADVFGAVIKVLEQR